MQTIKAEVLMTDEALFEHIHETGWSQYEWWQEAEQMLSAAGDPLPAYVVTCYPNNPKCKYWEKANYITKTVTINDIAAAFNALPAAQLALLASGLDPDMADQVMQVAVYGEVIFS
jgi:hypothetical protein